MSLIFLNSQSLPTVIANPYDIYNIELAPQPLIYGQNMSVRIQFDCLANINSAKLYIYKITEDMICACDFVYVSMYEITSWIECATAQRFEGNRTVDFPLGMQIGYRIQILYENFTVLTVPNSVNFIGIDTIEPLNNELMFDAGKVQESTNVESTNVASFSKFIILGSALLISFVLYRKRRSRVKYG